MENENMRLYERFRTVPDEAKKVISAGRLKGMTDINPMWRLKKLTEEFGPCGTGWWIENVRFWVEDAQATQEKLAFCTLEIVIKDGKRLFGIGGSKMVAKETVGYYGDDECYKKAYTDAISVACKSLGMGADVYFQNDAARQEPQEPKKEPKKEQKKDHAEKATQKSNFQIVKELIAGKNIDVASICYNLFGVPIKVNDMTDDQFDALCKRLKNEIAG